MDDTVYEEMQTDNYSFVSTLPNAMFKVGDMEIEAEPFILEARCPCLVDEMKLRAPYRTIFVFAGPINHNKLQMLLSEQCRTSRINIDCWTDALEWHIIGAEMQLKNMIIKSENYTIRNCNKDCRSEDCALLHIFGTLRMQKLSVEIAVECISCDVELLLLLMNVQTQFSSEMRVYREKFEQDPSHLIAMLCDVARH